MRLWVGTSGYNYDAWRGPFYPEDLPKARMLSYYAGRFPSVEINYSFYRKPSVKTLEGWAAQVPPGFRFVLKAWQRITHQQRLRDAGELVATFCDTARALGERLGPILFQLPPNLKKDAGLLSAFFATLPPDVRAALEFRHPSWLDDEVFGLLAGAGASLCVAESEELATPLVRTAPWGYLRLRREDYDDAAIDRWAERIRGAGWEGDVYAFFKHEDAARGTALAAGLAARLASG